MQFGELAVISIAYVAVEEVGFPWGFGLEVVHTAVAVAAVEGEGGKIVVGSLEVLLWGVVRTVAAEEVGRTVVADRLGRMGFFDQGVENILPLQSSLVVVGQTLSEVEVTRVAQRSVI